jgi:hypothetical protein
VAASNTIQLGNASVTNVKTSGTVTAGAVTYPNTDGSANQVLTTTGSGTLTWTTPSSGGGSGVPYTGATQAVDLGAYDLKVNGLIVGRGIGGEVSNTAIGISALNSNTTGSGNTASGYSALNNTTTGSNNTATGTGALSGNTTGSDNTSFGRSALLLNTTGSGNTASGNSALITNTTGGGNTAGGNSALYNNTTGGNNTATGTEALKSNTTGSTNMATGSEALWSNTTGSSNTATGARALFANTTGSNNTAIGNGADVGSGALTNATALGNGAIVAASNTVQLGNASVTNVKTSGTVTAGAVTYPRTDGTNGQVLTTNASGVASWTTPAVGGFTHHLGEAFNGGIIFYLYKGSDGLEHGLIVALTESTDELKWQTGNGSLVNANHSEDGVYNTNLMTNSPAKDYIASLGAGWYLPSIDELGLLYYNRFTVQKALRAGTNTLLSGTANYWSSTEYDAEKAYYFIFVYGSAFNAGKYLPVKVRGVRAF